MARRQHPTRRWRWSYCLPPSVSLLAVLTATSACDGGGAQTRPPAAEVASEGALAAETPPRGGPGRRANPDVAEASGHPPIHYAVRLSGDMKTLHERVCFQGQAPRSITTSKDGERFVRHARGPSGETLAFDSGIVATAGFDDACVTFDIDITAMLGTGGWGMGTRALDVGGDLVLSPSFWLWYPGRKSERAPARVDFDLPEGVSVAVGWRRVPGDDPHAFELAPGDYDWRTHAAFGRFDLRDVPVGSGQQLELAVLGGARAPDVDGLERWISAAANAVAGLFDGRFPRDRATIMVVPVPGGGGPVHFGLVVRGGQPAVIFFVASDATADELIGEWVAVHELTHLAMPYVRKRDAWLSEGLATYYQEVLRARAGLYEQAADDPDAQSRAAVEKMSRGFSRGLRGAGRLSLAEASDGMRGGFGRVYWGGAIVAFLLDLELWTASDGARGLDDVMQAWMRCCGEQRKIWSAQELFDAVAPEVAKWTGQPPGQLAARAQALIDARPTPDPTVRWDELGFELDERGRARLDPAASARQRDLRAHFFHPPSAQAAKADPR